MTSTRYEKKREGKKKKEKKSNFGSKSCQTTIHAPLRERKNAKTNQIIRYNHSYNHWNQLHAPL